MDRLGSPGCGWWVLVQINQGPVDLDLVLLFSLSPKLGAWSIAGLDIWLGQGLGVSSRTKNKLVSQKGFAYDFEFYMPFLITNKK